MITEHIRPILVVTGAMTAGAAGFLLFPRSFLRHVLGLAEIGKELKLVTRLLGLFLFLIGASQEIPSWRCYMYSTSLAANNLHMRIFYTFGYKRTFNPAQSTGLE